MSTTVARSVGSAPPSGPCAISGVASALRRSTHSVTAGDLESCRCPAGMCGRGAHGRAGAGESSLQFCREQQVRQLRLAVGPERAVGTTLPLQVVEIDVRGAVRAGSDSHDAVGDAVDEEIGECEVAEVIHTELAFEAVLGELSGTAHGAGIVDQVIERCVDAGGELPHRGE